MSAQKYNTVRTFSNQKMSQIVNYEDVVTYKDRTDVLLIDVRDPNELQDTGTIPGSINIPCEYNQSKNQLKHKNLILNLF